MQIFYPWINTVPRGEKEAFWEHVELVKYKGTPLVTNDVFCSQLEEEEA